MDKKRKVAEVEVPRNVLGALVMAHGKQPRLPGALLTWGDKLDKLIRSMSPEEYKLYVDLLHTPEGYMLTGTERW